MIKTKKDDDDDGDDCREGLVGGVLVGNVDYALGRRTI